MIIDENKIDEFTLSLMYLTFHDGCRAWKQMDFETMNRLHEKGFIENPINKSKSVIFTESGLKRSKELFEQYFSK